MCNIFSVNSEGQYHKHGGLFKGVALPHVLYSELRPRSKYKYIMNILAAKNCLPLAILISVPIQNPTKSKLATVIAG